jgi:hypothetical protein
VKNEQKDMTDIEIHQRWCNEKRCFVNIDEEIDQLRKDQKIWQKVCAYEKQRWEVFTKQYFPMKKSSALEEHMKNIDHLALKDDKMKY